MCCISTRKSGFLSFQEGKWTWSTPPKSDFIIPKPHPHLIIQDYLKTGGSKTGCDVLSSTCTANNSWPYHLANPTGFWHMKDFHIGCDIIPSSDLWDKCKTAELELNTKDFKVHLGVNSIALELSEAVFCHPEYQFQKIYWEGYCVKLMKLHPQQFCLIRSSSSKIQKIKLLVSCRCSVWTSSESRKTASSVS